MHKENITEMRDTSPFHQSQLKIWSRDWVSTNHNQASPTAKTNFQSNSAVCASITKYDIQIDKYNK